MFLLGFILATFALKKLATKYDLDSEALINCALVCFIGGIFGARLYFVLLSLPYFINHPMEIFAVWQGGLSIHGGIIGALLIGIWYARRNKLSILSTADILACVAPLAQAVGRWGNFFNCELFGKPVSADFFLKQYIPLEMRPAQFINNDFFHPAFLYESAWDLVLFLLLYFMVFPKFKDYAGITFFVYIVAYSIGRILIEPMRLDSIMLGSLQIPLLVSFIFLVIGLIALAILKVRYQNHNLH
jgi:phosphatidylglycerol:prolipoprotein diacylglycerol transferase